MLLSFFLFFFLKNFLLFLPTVLVACVSVRAGEVLGGGGGESVKVEGSEGKGGVQEGVQD